jgi:hypothetical protein
MVLGFHIDHLSFLEKQCALLLGEERFSFYLRERRERGRVFLERRE